MEKIIILILLCNSLIVKAQKEPYLPQQYFYPDFYKSYIPYQSIRYFIADKMAYPVNHGSIDGYEDANPFQRFSWMFYAKHLGADISGIEGGDSDLGDTIYCIGNGIVNIQIGSIIMVLHNTPKGYIVSQYRHCKEIFVTLGQKVNYLQAIGTIGNEDGVYEAHLHFEIRTDIFKDICGGYGDPEGYVDPMKFIKEFNNTEFCSTIGAERWVDK